MDILKDKDRLNRLKRIEKRLKDPKDVSNVDCLLDTVQALVADCDHPILKRMKNIEAYMQRCKSFH